MKSLYLASGEQLQGTSFGAEIDSVGEVVFTTGMTGYLETLTDPSYYGQIVTFTFPLIGNYGVFDQENAFDGIDATFESSKIWVKGVIITENSESFSHCKAFQSFQAWLQKNNIPALYGVDTRELTQILREKGAVMGSISDKMMDDYSDPLNGKYVPEVSPTEIKIHEPGNFNGKTIAFVDCGAKNGIYRNFLQRGCKVIQFPFDHNPYNSEYNFDGIFFSNGPGDPETVTETIETMQDALTKNKPIFGICLGNQMLGIACGGKTVKMDYGHRGVNQPVQEQGTQKCIVTSQNHGYVVDEESLPKDFEVWFKNLNDNSVEGIKHKSKPFFAVQFHPEACSGPEDAQYLFDMFIDTL